MDEFDSSFFDTSSEAWRENKKRKGQMFVYVCKKVGCNRKPVEEYCSYHTVLPSKKLKHGYFLRERPSHAVYSHDNARDSV